MFVQSLFANLAPAPMDGCSGDNIQRKDNYFFVFLFTSRAKICTFNTLSGRKRPILMVGLPLGGVFAYLMATERLAS